MIFRRYPWFALLALALLAQAPHAQAQMLKKMLNRAVDKIEQRLEQGAEDGADKAVDGVVCLVTDPQCRGASAGQQSSGDVAASSGSESAGLAGGGPADGARVGEGAWANFDFVTGDRVLFTEDFSAERVGNFPRRLQMREGNMEVVDWNGGRYLRSTAEGAFDIVLPEKLPQQFTIEFDLYDPTFWPTYVYTVDAERSAEKHTRAFFASNRESGLLVGKPTSGMKSSVRAPNVDPGMVRVSIMADGDYMKVFLDEKRVANMPSTDFPRSNRIRFALPRGTKAGAVLVGNITVAAGGTPLYDTLASDGLVSVRGILFDTNSDRIRPDSSATLGQIGDMLRKHADLRLRIEGHTDNVGSAAANQALSERRAAAIRTHLIGSHGIQGGRLQSVGMGQESPTAPNDTAEGRQNNRRVVLVKI